MDGASLLTAAGKGALAGSAIMPGVGTALGAAAGVVLNLAPEIGQWVFGANAAPAVTAIQQAVTAVTGTADPATQVAALEDPDTAAQLRVQLAAISAQCAQVARQADLAEMAAWMADTHDARAQTLALVQANSPLSWGAAVISAVVLVTFGAAMMFALLRDIPPNAAPVVNILLGTLTTMATSVVSYWVGRDGSSIGRRRCPWTMSMLIVTLFIRGVPLATT